MQHHRNKHLTRNDSGQHSVELGMTLASPLQWTISSAARLSTNMLAVAVDVAVASGPLDGHILPAVAG
jgi:hypothetical protein